MSYKWFLAGGCFLGYWMGGLFFEWAFSAPMSHHASLIVAATYFIVGVIYEAMA